MAYAPGMERHRAVRIGAVGVLVAVVVTAGACSRTEQGSSPGTSAAPATSSPSTTPAPGAGSTFPGTSLVEAPCTPAAMEDAYRASASGTPTRVTNVHCVGTWALADVETAETGTTDMTQLFQANGLVWAHLGDVVPVDAATLTDLGVPAATAQQLADQHLAGVGR